MLLVYHALQLDAWMKQVLVLANVQKLTEHGMVRTTVWSCWPNELKLSMLPVVNQRCKCNTMREHWYKCASLLQANRTADSNAFTILHEHTPLFPAVVLSGTCVKFVQLRIHSSGNLDGCKKTKLSFGRLQVAQDDDGLGLSPLQAGRVMAQHYIDFETMVQASCATSSSTSKSLRYQLCMT